ncbi:YbfB/YjiJ family MFS transporter [Noviherbaspirillum sp. Root189]|uniref:YbfB/YjiJ family MFS transporter n=1 Tax=Noviherbaspirillum sp. Root189 TaxID=1736487 RepID=UPI0007100E29|nr:YbfB/YjiJ family MFS transporter [Noviherbaspirillum sp. Root189]KRB70606.1 MFS transporter [Noviherbaspirillum sp. Root189]
MDKYANGKRSTLPIVLAGVVSLAVAMGIGRFAFTPLLPLMMRDGLIDITIGTEWAAANYLGYLLGALTASRFGTRPLRGMHFSLIGIGLTTLGIAVFGGSSSTAGAILRGAAGVFSAWSLVCTSGWCLGELAARKASERGSWIFTGVGLGITLTGLLTWLGANQSATALWVELGALACAGAVLNMACAKGSLVSSRPPLTNKASGAGNEQHDTFAVVICYSAFGVGYIIPATFLPTMARQLTSNPQIFGLAWPLFGLAAVISVALVSQWMGGWSRARLWAMAQGCMALGTLLPLFITSPWSIAMSAVLVGGTFMVVTMAGLQAAREMMPDNPTVLVGRMTAGFASGQILGPLLVRMFDALQIAGWDGIQCSNAFATLLLFATAIWLWRIDRSRSLRALFS